MKKILISIAAGCALTVSAASHAAGDTAGTNTAGTNMSGMDMSGMDMSGMDMSGDAKQGGDAAGRMSHGEIRKVDAAAGKLTIRHGPLENLGMDGMTMAFKVGDPAMLSRVKVGDQVDFVAEYVGGALTVVELRKP
ncbi:copper-binding protein [Burkholderia stagnalis]